MDEIGIVKVYDTQDMAFCGHVPPDIHPPTRVWPHADVPPFLRITSNGQVLAKKRNGRSLKRWTVSKFAQPKTIPLHDQPITKVQYASNGRYFVTQDGFDKVYVWDEKNAKLKAYPTSGGLFVLGPDHSLWLGFGELVRSLKSVRRINLVSEFEALNRTDLLKEAGE